MFTSKLLQSLTIALIIAGCKTPAPSESLSTELEAAAANGLSGTWKNADNPALLIFAQDGLGQTAQLTIDTHGAPGAGFGSLKRVDYARFVGEIDQKNAANCTTRFFYVFDIVDSDSVDVAVTGSNGKCGNPTSLNTVYNISRLTVDAPSSETLTGSWKTSVYNATIELDQDGMGQVMQVTILNPQGAGAGFGTAKRVSATEYAAEIDQQKPNGCTVRNYYTFEIQTSELVKVKVTGSNGKCGSATTLNIAYTISRQG